MKTATDPRHLKRIAKIKQLYAYNFQPKKDYLLIQPILSHLKKIDALIVKAAPEWPIAQINKIDLAILRLGVYELLFTKKTPDKVVIDEAVELGKTFGSESTPGFVNAVLGHILKNND